MLTARFKLGLLLAVACLVALVLLVASQPDFAQLRERLPSPPQQQQPKKTKAEGRYRSKPRIAIVTYYSPNEMGNELRAMTWKNKQDYARLHGYDIYDVSLMPGLPEKIAELKERMKYNFYFFKFLGLLELLNGPQGRQYDWLVWQDADSIFFNFGRNYETLVDPAYDVIMTAGPPDMAQWANVVNMGSFIVRNSDFTRRLLEEAMTMSEHGCHALIKERPEMLEQPLNGWLYPCNADGNYWLSDQGLMMALYLWKPADYRCHFKRIWFQAMHSEFPWYSDGDLAVHFPGKANEERKRLIRAFNKYADYEIGKVDHQYTDLLEPKECLGNDLVAIEKLYQPFNQPCLKPNAL